MVLPTACVDENENSYPAFYTAAANSNEAIAMFSQALFQEVLVAGGENAVISPLSAYFALAMVAQGASGQTLDEFHRLLNWQPNDLAPELYKLAELLTNTRGDTVLNIAGSVWFSDAFTVNEQFNNTMKNYFDAPAYSRDFFSPATVNEINNWVYDRTEGLIDDIVEGFTPYDVMLLINALYFKGQWANAWGPMVPQYDTFYLACGEDVEVELLATSASQFYVTTTEQYQATMLPYECGQFGFMLVRPTDDTPVRDFALTHNLADIFGNLQQQQHVIIRMPGFDFEYEITMNNVLQNMGLRNAFDDSNADFTGLVNENHRPIYISEVLQKARIIVDRYGTEAAAVTAVRVEFLMARYPSPTVLTFNTPYLYVIYHLPTGIPLFMGVVDDPR